MSDIEHWWCPFCGAFDGPISDLGICDVCAADLGDEADEVECLVPKRQLVGAVQVDEVVRVLRERADIFISRRTRGAFFHAAEVVADVFGGKSGASPSKEPTP